LDIPELMQGAIKVSFVSQTEKEQPMSETGFSAQQEMLAQQAYMLRVIYPDLYEFLVQRDKMLQQVLQRIPDPSDPEALTARSDLDTQIVQLKRLPSGVKSMADACERLTWERFSVGH
jgi:hypothetical protein